MTCFFSPFFMCVCVSVYMYMYSYIIFFMSEHKCNICCVKFYSSVTLIHHQGQFETLTLYYLLLNEMIGKSTKLKKELTVLFG